MGVASCAVAPCCTWPCPFGRHNLHPRGKTFGTGERPNRDYAPTLSGAPKKTLTRERAERPLNIPTKWTRAGQGLEATGGAQTVGRVFGEVAAAASILKLSACCAQAGEGTIVPFSTTTTRTTQLAWSATSLASAPTSYAAQVALVSRPQPNGLIPSSPFRKFFPLEALSQCDMSRVQAKATAGPRKRILTSEYAPEEITKIRRRFPE